MKDTLKNIVYAGIGAAALTKEKVEEMASELVAKGRITQEESKNFIDDLLRKSEKAKDQLDLWVSKRVEERIKQLNLVTKDEFDELSRKIEELQASLNKGSDQ